MNSYLAASRVDSSSSLSESCASDSLSAFSLRNESQPTKSKFFNQQLPNADDEVWSDSDSSEDYSLEDSYDAEVAKEHMPQTQHV